MQVIPNMRVKLQFIHISVSFYIYIYIYINIYIYICERAPFEVVLFGTLTTSPKLNSTPSTYFNVFEIIQTITTVQYFVNTTASITLCNTCHANTYETQPPASSLGAKVKDSGRVRTLRREK